MGQRRSRAETRITLTARRRTRFAQATRGIVALAFAGSWLSACGPSRYEDKGDIVMTTGPGATELAKQLNKEQLLQRYVMALNERFKFPRDLHVAQTKCGEPNSFYKDGTLYLCYELLDEIATKAAHDPEEQYREQVEATWTFAFFHELAHALMDFYDLHVVVAKEDAADQFSSMLMIETKGLRHQAFLAADYWKQSDPGMYDEVSFADEHSLDLQRFYNILCWVYGSDPDEYNFVVRQGELPPPRAQRCESEYAEALSAWQTLLEPWLKD